MEIVLNTFGTSLNRENECFVIRNADGKQSIPAEGITSIRIGKSAQITSDAIALAIEREIEVFFVDKSGSIFGRIWSSKYGSISTIRKGQLNFSMSKYCISWIKGVIQRKIENQQALLLMMEVNDSSIQNAVQSTIRRLDDYRAKVGGIEGEVISDVSATLRGWEGVASRIFFDSMNMFLPKAYRFEKRSQHPAMDVTNAFLNYGYGLLYGKVEGALIRAGIDPYIGVLHRDDYNRPVLVYDVIELYRVWVEYVVYTLLIQNAITDEYYSVQPDGSYWLEALGRRVLIQSLNDYLDETVEIRGITRSRQQQIFLYCQSLAQQFKNMQAI